MKKNKIIEVTFLLVMCAPYLLAFSAVRGPGDSDSEANYELNRCVEHWRKLGIERVLPDASSASRSVLLEIGNGGFPRYDYILVEGERMRTSLGPAEGALSAQLKEDIDEIYLADVAALRDSEAGQVDDSDCYFLTIDQKVGRQTVAIYGKPRSALPLRLIDRMLHDAKKLAADAGSDVSSSL